MLTITHGVLLSHGSFDGLIHEIDEIIKNDIKKEPKKVNRKETEIFDNSNRGLFRY